MSRVDNYIPAEDDDAPASKVNGNASEKTAEGEGVSLDDFLAYMPQHSYIFVPSREMWPAAASMPECRPIIGPDGKPISPAKWLDANAAVEQMTWAPGEPMLIEDRLISDGGWIERPGCTVFNLYRPPTIVPRAGDVAPWLDLVRKVFPNEADHIVHWLAHRVQRPHEKINHALVLGGKPGIGKDTILEPVKQAIGPWNFADVSPQAGARPLQRLPEVGHPARERGARPRRVRPLRLPRPHEGLSSPRRPTCCASTRRTSASTTSPTSAA